MSIKRKRVGSMKENQVILQDSFFLVKSVSGTG